MVSCLPHLSLQLPCPTPKRFIRWEKKKKGEGEASIVLAMRQAARFAGKDGQRETVVTESGTDVFKSEWRMVGRMG